MPAGGVGMEQISAGAIAMGFAIAGLFFLRFWRQTRDRLFAFFAVAFVILAVNRVGTGVFPVNEEQGDHLYWVRFFAFLMILLAIIDKNRSRKRPPSKPPVSG
jgi:hypothetical protein